MSSKTRIIVLHMKEIIYTAVFLALAVVLAVVLFFMFGPGKMPVIQPAKNPATSRASIPLPSP
ncbi:MAG: hypothetical protein ACLR6B_12775 [Blautia sp.]